MTGEASAEKSTWTIEKSMDQERYPNGFFKLNYKPRTATEPNEIKRLNDLARKINNLVQTCGRSADRTKKNSDLLNQGRSLRVKELKALAEELEDGRIEDHKAFEEYGRIEGHYYAQSMKAENHESAKISYSEKKENGEPGKSILTIEELQEGATTEQISLSIDILRAYEVVDIVLDRRSKNRGIYNTIKERLALRQNYVSQLKKIADEGLLNRTLTNYAERKLNLFKYVFVQREADYVKNQHIKTLGLWAILLSAVFLFLIVILKQAIEVKLLTSNAEIIQSFLFLAIGASVGTWMSFTMRKVELGFDDLILLEPDRLNPVPRIIFVVILTFFIGGILQLGWIEISISDIKKLKPSLGILEALLIGVTCGIAERSLSGAIIGRADSVSNLINPILNTKKNIRGENHEKV